MRFLPFAMAFVALAACSKPAHEAAPTTNTQSAAAADAVPHKGVDRSHKGERIPDVELRDAMSIDMESKSALPTLAEGKPMLVNLWASWCAPCVKELPTLQVLMDKRHGQLSVVPVSQDSGPQKSVEAFLDNLKLDFVAYQDPDMALSGALKAEVLPTTILYDAKGREVWRYVGDLDWTSPEAAKLIAEAKS